MLKKKFFRPPHQSQLTEVKTHKNTLFTPQISDDLRFVQHYGNPSQNLGERVERRIGFGREEQICAHNQVCVLILLVENFGGHNFRSTKSEISAVSSARIFYLLQGFEFQPKGI